MTKTKSIKKRLFAIGDIHGCYHSFRELIEDKIQLQKSDQLILLGDYIDRGNKSKEVIDYIIELLEKGFDLIPLMGNHEAMLLEAFENEKNISKWIQNGGNETLKSFGITSIKNLESKYLKFFKELKYYYSLDKYLFVHAGFNNDLVNPFEDKYAMLWYCKESYHHPLLNDKTIIHGHCPIAVNDCKRIVQRQAAVINIDTGCVYDDKQEYGILTVYDCNAHKLYFV